MPAPAPTVSSPRLRALARRRVAAAQEPDEHCELCGTPIAAEHRHVLDLRSRELLCACRACGLLFDRSAAGGDHYRLVPSRRLSLPTFALSDRDWAELRIPVEMAFFYRHGGEGRTMAFYPSPMGATESRLDLAAWSGVEAANPVLATMEPDVEALLVDRSRGARRQWLVPIEDPFRLVALIRTRWRGFTGGREVWAEIDAFFAELERTARRCAPTTAAPAGAAGGGSDE